MSQVVDPNLDYIKKKIREYMNEIADHLTIGGAKNFDEYQRSVGKVEALAIIEREILDLENKITDD
jgi:hypothetical protein|tara:strand:+ start:105 stop:302 length:198 start_codon:yes stop_codon:yes gene_type:complete